MLTIARATTTKQLSDAAGLMRAFVEWARDLSPLDRKLVDLYFDQSAFDKEMETLPGRYGPPTGCLLIAEVDNLNVGCVAMRRFDDEYCEMKRMFVLPSAHGRGIGQALAEQIIDAAKSAGYGGMRLDTSKNQHPAIALYGNLGFKRRTAYYEIPDDFRDWLIFFERKFY